jgi:glycosyl transferase, family 25
MTDAVPILFINMDEDRDRRDRMAAMLAARGLPHERLSAVDGRALDPAAKVALCPRRRLWWRRHPMSDGEIGLCASHLAALRRIAEGCAPLGCVMEDDALLDPDAAAFLRAPAVPPGVGMVKLEGSRHPLPRAHLTLGRAAGRRLIVPGMPRWRAAAYVVTRDAAAQLVARLTPMRGPVDGILFEPWKTGVTVAELWPFPVTQTGESTMEARFGTVRRRDARVWLVALIRLLRGHLWLVANLPRLWRIRVGMRR